MSNPLVSVLIPTFNRAHLIGRALQSVFEQDYYNLEILVVDDGSEDETNKIVSEYKSKFNAPIRYIYKKNGGKHSAFNAALKCLSGEFTIILDSDDQLAKNAIATLIKHWHAIPIDRRHLFCGVEGLCAYAQTGKIEGDCFPYDVFDSDYVSLRYKFRIKGDKKIMARTCILKEYPYPEFQNENHLRPSLVWKRIAKVYYTRFINEIVQYKELQPTGLSSDRKNLRHKNVQGYKFYYLEDVNEYQITFAKRLKSAIKYVSYSLLANTGLIAQYNEIKSKRLWLLALPIGFIKYLRAKYLQ